MTTVPVTARKGLTHRLRHALPTAACTADAVCAQRSFLEQSMLQLSLLLAQAQNGTTNMQTCSSLEGWPSGACGLTAVLAAAAKPC